MKVREIIVNEAGLIATAGEKVFGGLAKSGAKALTPAAMRQAAKAEKVAQFKGDLSLIGGVLGNWWKVIKNSAIALGILEPMVTTAYSLIQLKKQLEAKEISPEQYETYVQGVLGECVAKVALIGVTSFTVKAIGGIIGTLPFGKGLGKVIGAAGSVATAGLSVYLATPAGSHAFAQWFVGNSFAPWLATFMRDWVGSWVKEGYDLLIGHEDARGPVTGSATGNSVSDAFKSIPAAKNPMGMKFDSGTGVWTNRGPNADGST